VGAVAGAAARHPLRVLAVWATVVAVALALTFSLLPGALSPVMELLTPKESQRADELLEEVRGPLKAQEAIVVSSSIYTVDDPPFRRQVEAIKEAVLALGPEVVDSVFTYYDTGLEALRSGDGRATVVVVVLPKRAEQAARTSIGPMRQAVAEAAQEGFQVAMAGQASFEHDLEALAERDVRRAELVGVPVAALVLTLVFGALAAVVLPLTMAGVAIVVALGIMALVGQAVSLPVFTTNMVVTMGLAVGIDYALFVLSRYRDERREGVEPARAIGVAGATAVRAVFFSGLVVILSLAGLMLVPLSVFVGVSAGAAAAVAVAVLACLTLLPALLSLLKDKTSALPVPLPRVVEAFLRGEWWTRIVLRRPLLSAALGLLILLPLAAVALTMKTGIPGFETMPDWLPSKRGFLALEGKFSYGVASPVEVVVEGDLEAPATQSAIEALRGSLMDDPAFAPPVLVQTFPEHGVALVTAAMHGDPTGDEAREAIKRLRGSIIPEAFRGAPAQALVTGDAARFLDYAEVSSEYAPLVYGFVLGLSALLLMVAFRSAVLPLVAVALNLLSVGAAYGLLVLVFQEGWGRIIGLPRLEAMAVWLPLFLFALVFGLSMDYQVFLLSRVREIYGRTGDAAEAVARGLDATSSVITGAAMIMVTVFAVMAAGELAELRQVGFGLAAAVFIDATLVRLVLLPAVLRIMGRWAWYLPPFLRWLPQFPLAREA